jgi:hypothetical protein
MQELFRSSNMAQLQGVQPQMGQQQHQQMSPAPIQPAAQQPSFQEQQGSHPPPNFSSMQQMQMRNQLMQPFTTNQSPMVRQLDMLALAQQPQNGGVNMTAGRMAQQPQHQQPGTNNQAGPNQSGQGNIFTSAAPDIHTSPSRVALQPPIPTTSQGPTFNNNFDKIPPDMLVKKLMELRQRAKDIQTAVTTAEAERQRIVDMRTSMPDAEFQTELATKHRDILSKQDVLQKLHGGIAQIQIRLQGRPNGSSPNDRGNM